ncbi:MAG: hypothetical protein KAH48_02615, partial [Chlorobi bacterium]|nr:hypothetical protein [Chlorobiota bacterium]
MARRYASVFGRPASGKFECFCRSDAPYENYSLPAELRIIIFGNMNVYVPARRSCWVRILILWEIKVRYENSENQQFDYYNYYVVLFHFNFEF